MAIQLPGDSQLCRLLECPREIRDQIYADVLLDVPNPSLECLLDRAVHEVHAIVWEEGQDGRDQWHQRWEESNLAPAFHDYAIEFLQKPQKIDTNILLANRQTFAEAKEIILRRAHLVKVVTSNVDLSRRLCASQLCLLDAKYSNLCVMTHYWNSTPPPTSEFVLYGRDIENFCRAITGDTAFLLRPRLCPATRHTLEFTTNFHHENTVPEYLSREKVHQQILRPYRKRLRGFSRVSLQGSCVGLGKALADTAVKDMKSRLIPDPDDILSEMQYLLLLSQGDMQKFSYSHRIIPIYKAIDLCKLIVRDSDVWAGIKNKASDRTAFVEDILCKAYQSLVEQVTAWSIFDPFILPQAPYTAYVMHAYEMSLAAATSFGAPGWSPPTRLEFAMNHCVAQELFRHRETYVTGKPVAIGCKAAQRALELEPKKKQLKELVKSYEDWREKALQLGYSTEIDDDLLVENGVVWWSGSQPWSYMHLYQ